MDEWLALTIGNSRFHWALFENETLQHSWDAPPMDVDVAKALVARPGHFISLSDHKAVPKIWLASVVPSQTELWTAFSSIELITLSQIPLHQIYPTFGIDRALVLWGAIVTYGSPALVIDCGTAMTFTGADLHHNLIGGAILPGLRLQFGALGQRTAALPNVEIETLSDLPTRWARHTTDAIASGILHGAIATIRDFALDWQQKFSDSAIVMTGGDAGLLYRTLNQELPEVSKSIRLDLNLAFWGIREVRRRLMAD